MNENNSERFPWESDLPQGTFWKTLPNENIGRQFLRVFTVDEIAAMELDSKVDFDEVSKLQLLESLVLERMTSQLLLGPPEALSSNDFYNKWHRREFLLAHVQRAQGGKKLADAEQRYRLMIDVWAKRDDPDKKWPQDLGSIDNLFIILAQEARYIETEQLARELIGLIRQCPDLGYGSPMNIGIMLKLMDLLGKQGRFDEALVLNKEADAAIDVMVQGKFAKYGDMQKKSLYEMRTALERHDSWESGYLIIR